MNSEYQNNSQEQSSSQDTGYQQSFGDNYQQNQYQQNQYQQNQYQQNQYQQNQYQQNQYQQNQYQQNQYQQNQYQGYTQNQSYPQGQYYQQNNYYMQNPAPAFQLKTNRSLLVMLLLSIVTCGIYPIILMSGISTDINVIASRYDGRRTMHFCLLYFLVAGLTCGIGALVWYHNISDRIGNELRRRGINYSFSALSFWGWNILGALIIVGPFIYMYKLFKAMNLLSEHYNFNG